MFKIALCDDDEGLLREAGQCVQEYLRGTGVSAALTTYTSSVCLNDSVTNGERFDVYILDVEMPEIDGFQIAKTIRGRQSDAVIIFLTSHLELAQEGYKVEALRYVHKLKLEQELPEALDRAMKLMEGADRKALFVQHYTLAIRIMLKDIIYVCKAHRSVQIITVSQGTIVDNRGIKDIFNAINDPRFIFTDRSYFVNLDYIQRMDKTSITMMGGTVLPISRPMLPKVKEAMIALWGGK